MTKTPAPPPSAHKAALILLAITFLAVTILRITVLQLPLERDEGEYAYVGQLMLHGIPPYQLAYNMKWPGTYAAYAAIIGILGTSIQAIRIGTLIVTSITALLVFFLGRRLWGTTAGAVAASTQLVFSVAIEALGFFGHATHFVALCATAGFLLLTSEKRAQIFAAGLMLGLAVVMKQPGIFFVVAAGTWLVVRRAWRDLLLFIAGGATTLLFMIGALYASGVFPRFWFWTIQYAREYGNAVGWDDGKEMLTVNFGRILAAAPLLWLLAAAGAFLATRQRLLAILFAVAGLLSIVPGFHFRDHYFLAVFPAIALLVSAAVTAPAIRWPQSSAARSIPALIFVVGLGAAFVHQWQLADRSSMEVLSRQIYGPEPFPESVEIAKYIREHSTPDDRIAVLGSEPQIYYYSERTSATGYLYMYPLMEPQKFATTMQKELMDEITRAKPKYLVVVNEGGSWGVFPGSDRTILNWMWSRAGNGWTVEGVADMLDGHTEYVWGEQARTYRAQSQNSILLLRRDRS